MVEGLGVKYEIISILVGFGMLTYMHRGDAITTMPLSCHGQG